MLCCVFEKVVIGPYKDPVSLQVLEGGCLMFFIWMLAGEVTGDGLRYSKFARSAGALTCPSRVGMAIMYSPSFLLASAFLVLKLTHSPLLPWPSCNPRLLLLASALSLHFLKRVLEVLFLHKYSGSMEVMMSLLISGGYATASAVIIYAQQLAVEREEPEIDLQKWGVGVFLVGIVGNFYHHYLLAKLRSNKKNTGSRSKYMVPQGGLFTWVVCPHYLFESIGFFGIAMIAQTFSAVLVAVGMSASLCARSYKTKDWYLKKVEGFPASRKPFFPFLF